MSDVTFQEEAQYQRSRSPEARTGSVIGLMYKLGLAKTKKDANLVMSGIIAVCLVLSATMFVFVQPHTDSAQASQLEQDVAHLQAQQAAQQTRQQTLNQ